MIKADEDQRVAYCASKIGAKEDEVLESFKKYQPDFMRGRLSEADFWRLIFKDLKISKSRPKKSLWIKAMMQVYWEDKEVFSIAQSLKKSGYKIALLSDTEKPIVTRFAKKPVHQIFDLKVFSCLEGTLKGDGKLYQLILRRLRVKPEEAVFINDKRENVKFAQKLRIKGVLFEDASNLRKDLVSLGLVFKKR